ncbi:MAG: hypothetical protein LUC43_00645, partial [Burkholderiales bacterium]|nr:hypothetical protein [Burkholderiales bacterium]
QKMINTKVRSTFLTIGLIAALTTISMPCSAEKFKSMYGDKWFDVIPAKDLGKMIRGLKINEKDCLGTTLGPLSANLNNHIIERTMSREESSDLTVLMNKHERECRRAGFQRNGKGK